MLNAIFTADGSDASSSSCLARVHFRTPCSESDATLLYVATVRQNAVAVRPRSHLAVIGAAVKCVLTERTPCTFYAADTDVTLYVCGA